MVVALSDPEARDPSVSGAKAANLARAAAAGFATLPGFVITTAAVCAGVDDPAVLNEVRSAYERLCADSSTPLVVRSSSLIEDAGESSMAGRFTSVLDVVGWETFLEATHRVVGSASAVRDAHGDVGSMAVLVQRQSDTRFGGVMFGVDPVTGSRDQIVVEVVPSGPDALVGGTAMADHYVLNRRGRIARATHVGHIPPLDHARRRALARMARRAERVFGTPQDIEWLVDQAGRLWLLQSRPVTAIAQEDGRDSVLLGPGPLAETFPAPLRPLEEDLWIPPLRDGIIRALRTTGAVSNRSIDRSPVVTTVDGWVAVDLELIGAVESRTTLRRRINPAAMVRRLETAWRVGRLRTALPRLADEAVATVDRDLAMIPRLDELADGDLVDLLDRTRRELATTHAYEVLTGMLLGEQDGLSGAAMALRALHDGRAAGWSDEAIVLGSPVVLAVTAPRLEDRPILPAVTSPPSGPVATIDHLGQREALRVRARWLQELLARAADELGRRLVARTTLPDVETVALLRLDELAAIGDGGPPPSDVAERRSWRPGPPLPVSFRLTSRGDLRPAGVSSHRRVLGGLTGLVSETGSALSHLAILAREAGLPTVVGVPDALLRFPPGTRMMIDGRTGDIEVLEAAPAPIDVRSEVSP